MTLEGLYHQAVRYGVHPPEFWDMTLAESILILKAREENERSEWNRTASLMALYANSKAQKGKTYKAEDFHPFEIADRQNAQPKTRADVDKLINKKLTFK